MGLKNTSVARAFTDRRAFIRGVSRFYETAQRRLVAPKLRRDNRTSSRAALRCTLVEDDDYARDNATWTAARVQGFPLAGRVIFGVQPLGDPVETETANATINRELSALKRMFTLAIQAGKLPMLAERNVRKGFFERAQFEAVRHRLPPTLQGLVTLAYYTGWPVTSELLPLEGRQVDRAAGVIRLEPGTTKNREGRVFTYAASAARGSGT
jgi:hypothetical protein